jgi:hypothetical protein
VWKPFVDQSFVVVADHFVADHTGSGQYHNLKDTDHMLAGFQPYLVVVGLVKHIVSLLILLELHF